LNECKIATALIPSNLLARIVPS